MLLSDNSFEVLDLMKFVDCLKNIDKVRLAIHILENKGFSTNYDIDSLINNLKIVMGKLDSNYNKVIVNFSKYESLLFLSAKYMEFKEIDKKKFTIELLFDIYESDFENEDVNKCIYDNINVYDYCCSLNV